ncbi:MAG: MFS transporter [Actinomycetota bacterium]
MTPVRTQVRETFQSLGSRNFRLFFLGQAISVTGTWVQQVASAWLVLRLSGSGVALGIDTGLTFLPLLLFGLRGGALADRADRRKILMVTNALLGVLAIALWAIVDTGVVQLWMVFGLSFLSGTVTAFDNPTRQSFYAEMVEEEHLTNAVSLNSAVMTGSRIIGPAVAAALIAGLGMGWCFLLNGVSYLAAIGALAAMRPQELRRSPARERGSVRETLAYVRGDEALWLPIVLMGVLYTLSFNFSVTMPLLAERTFGGTVSTYGTLLSFYGLGSFLGALAMARVRNPNPRRLAWAAVAFGVTQGLVATAPTLAAAHVLVVVFGIVSMGFMITGNTGLQLSARPEMRGRVMAIYAIIFLGGTPIGAPLTGALAEHLGPREAMAFGAIVAVLTGIAGLRALAGRRLAAPAA